MNLLWHITLLLRRLAVAVVVGHADAGWAVGLANDLDHVCWCAYYLLLETHSQVPFLFLPLFLHDDEKLTLKRLAEDDLELARWRGCDHARHLGIWRVYGKFGWL